MNAAAINLNPYGYGAKTLDEVLRYLTRHVNDVVLASDEDVYAAQLIEELSTQLKQQKNHNSSSTQLQQELDTLRAQISVLERENASLKIEKELDEQRLKYCLENTIIYSDGCLYADLEKEKVVDGNLRQAIDNLLSK